MWSGLLLLLRLRLLGKRIVVGFGWGYFMFADVDFDGDE